MRFELRSNAAKKNPEARHNGRLPDSALLHAAQTLAVLHFPNILLFKLHTFPKPREQGIHAESRFSSHHPLLPSQDEPC